MTPVAFPKVDQKTDPRTSAYEHRVALDKANKRLVNSRHWYEKVREDYARPD
jgi:hypothetical protein